MSEAEELEARRDELIETTEAEAVYAEEDRARAGCIVAIDDDGEFRLYEGLVERAASPSKTGDGAEEDGDEAFALGADGARASPRFRTLWVG